MNIAKQKQTHRCRPQISGAGRKEEGQNMGRRLRKVQTTRYKINYKDILHSTGNLNNIL